MPKKTKAVKITDKKAQKPWLKKAKDASYKIETKETYRTVLIVTEGQTEKLYFDSFPVLTLKVVTINLEGQTKLKLVESAKNIIENQNNNYDEVWCVFDMDFKKGAKEFADFDNAIEKANVLNYKVAYSNDAFELWFYLHYNFTDHKNLRTFYYKALSEKWDINYEKEGKKYKFSKNIYAKLESDNKASQQKAIDNADKLFQSQKHLPFHLQNPITIVYQLVNILNKQLRN